MGRGYEVMVPIVRARRILVSVVAALVVLAAPLPVAGGDVVVAEDDGPVTIEFFWGDGCPHCAAEEAFLDDLVARYPDVLVNAYEVWYDAANRARFERVAAAHGIEASAVPATFLGGRAWVGFSDRIGDEIEAVVRAELAQRGSASPSPSGSPDASPEPTPSTVEVPIIGPVDPARASLVVVTGLIALVDGFNPCSLWVLSVLLAMMLHSGSRRRLLAVGLTFLLVAGLAYGLFMIGLFAVLDWVGYGPWVRAGIATLIGVLGALAVRDYFASGGRFSVGIPEERKPEITRRSRQLALSERSLIAVVPMTAFLAAGVSLLELPCTAGFPVLWNGILAERGVAGVEFAGLLGVYLGIYLLDELVLFAAAVTTMRVTKMQERHGRALKLVAGSVMLALAAAMLVAPAVLESLAGALLVFGFALAVTAVILVTTARRRPAAAESQLAGRGGRARRARARGRATSDG
jgi:glutaredoxin